MAKTMVKTSGEVVTGSASVSSSPVTSSEAFNEKLLTVDRRMRPYFSGFWDLRTRTPDSFVASLSTTVHTSYDWLNEAALDLSAVLKEWGTRLPTIIAAKIFGRLQGVEGLDAVYAEYQPDGAIVAYLVFDRYDEIQSAAAFEATEKLVAELSPTQVDFHTRFRYGQPSRSVVSNTIPAIFEP